MMCSVRSTQRASARAHSHSQHIAAVRISPRFFNIYVGFNFTMIAFAVWPAALTLLFSWSSRHQTSSTSSAAGEGNFIRDFFQKMRKTTYMYHLTFCALCRIENVNQRWEFREKKIHLRKYGKNMIFIVVRWVCVLCRLADIIREKCLKELLGRRIQVWAVRQTNVHEEQRKTK